MSHHVGEPDTQSLFTFPSGHPRQKHYMTPRELDRQSPIKVARWLDLYSEECARLDEDIIVSRKWAENLLNHPNGLVMDSLGRLWGPKPDGTYYPFHFITDNNEIIGYRFAAKAAN